MMTTSTLRDAFLEDHQHLTRGFSDLIAAVRGDDPEDAGKIADELDRAAGPHIEFEETVYYPALVPALGADAVRRFYHEHAAGLRVIVAVLERDASKPFAEEEREALLADAREALDHALSCGTLLSHIVALDEERQAEMLDALNRTRGRGHRWSEMSHRD
jgi:hypothetical protein